MAELKIKINWILRSIRDHKVTLLTLLFFLLGAYTMPSKGHADMIHYVEVDAKENIDNSLFAILYLKHFPKLFSRFIPEENVSFIQTPIEYNDNFIYVEFFQSQEKGVSREQAIAYNNFFQNEELLAEIAKDALYSFYQELRPEFIKPSPQGIPLTEFEINQMFPKVIKGNELKEKIKLYSIIILPPKNGISTLVLSFSWSFDEDDGLYIHIRKNKVIKISDMYDDD